jgi:transposase
MSGRVHSRELKLTIVRQLASGEKRPAQICREHNLASSVVSRWRNEYDQRGEEAFLPPATSAPPTAEAKIAELERFCGQLALERYSPINGWKRVPKGLKSEASSVSCAYANKYRADECPPGILPEPGL